MLRIDRGKAGSVTTLRLQGDLDEGSVPELRITLLDLLRDGDCNLVVNLTGVAFVSYMGVGILVERLRQFRTAGGDIKLAGMNLYTQRLFRMVGVTSLFETFDTEAQAVRVYQQAA